jgi:predicted HicB family RNase H-like nuclease
MPKQPKQIKRKPGRPKLAEHEAKAKIVPVRFAAEEIERITKAAQKAEQTVSQWIRSTLAAAVEG